MSESFTEEGRKGMPLSEVALVSSFAAPPHLTPAPTLARGLSHAPFLSFFRSLVLFFSGSMELSFSRPLIISSF